MSDRFGALTRAARTVDNQIMSPVFYAVYWGLGLTLVLLGVWRFAAGRTAGTLRLTGLAFGLVILAIMAGSAVGVVSLGRGRGVPEGQQPQEQDAR
jgi:hypothetical protein